MDAGVLELIAILMSLNGFGIDANPKAPSPAQITKYEVSDADYRAYVDFEAFVPRNFKAFVDLPNKKAVQKSQRAHKALAELVKNAQAGRMFVKGMIGFDPIKDLKSLAVWVKLGANGPPTGIAVLRGNFPLDMIKRATNMARSSAQTINGHPAMMAPGGVAMVAFVKSDSALVVGTPALVKARLSKKWRRPRAKRGSPSARFAQLLRQKPFFAVASSPAANANQRVKAMVPAVPGKFFVDVLTEHKYAALAGFHNGIGWAWTDRGSKVGYQRALMASEGLIAIFRSMHYGVRGMAKVALSIVDSYAAMHPIAAMIAKHKKDILALVGQMSGSGAFKAKIKKQPRALSFQVRATGKSFSDVVPMAGLVPIFAGVAMLAGKADKRAERMGSRAAKAAMAQPSTAMRIVPIYRRVKAEKLKVNRKLR
jgi:hypothetical protein